MTTSGKPPAGPSAVNKDPAIDPVLTEGLGPPSAGFPWELIGELLVWFEEEAEHGQGDAWKMRDKIRALFAPDLPAAGPSEFSPVAKQDSVSEALTGKEGLEAAAQSLLDEMDALERTGANCVPSLGVLERIRAAIASEQPRAAPVDPSDSAPPEGLKDLERAVAAKDAAYAERNRVVAAMAEMARRLGWWAGTAQHHDKPGEAWEPDWRTIVFVDLPTGQVSWHFHDSEKHLLAALPPYPLPWDGHDTPEKYRRVRAFLGTSAGPGPQAPSASAVPATQMGEAAQSVEPRRECIDIRPYCIACELPWMPAEGENARTVPCPSCRTWLVPVEAADAKAAQDSLREKLRANLAPLCIECAIRSLPPEDRPPSWRWEGCVQPIVCGGTATAPSASDLLSAAVPALPSGARQQEVLLRDPRSKDSGQTLSSGAASAASPSDTLEGKWADWYLTTGNLVGALRRYGDERERASREGAERDADGARKAMLAATCGPVERAQWEDLITKARNRAIAAEADVGAAYARGRKERDAEEHHLNLALEARNDELDATMELLRETRAERDKLAEQLAEARLLNESAATDAQRPPSASGALAGSEELTTQETNQQRAGETPAPQSEETT